MPTDQRDGGISWTDLTWNVVRGCSRVSAGCKNCYAEVMAGRFSTPGQWGHTFAIYDDRGPRWTGKVELQPHLLDYPASVRKPKRIFVNSTSDLFHEDLPDEDIARVFTSMHGAPHHTFQVLTKRAGRMRDWFRSPSGKVWGAAGGLRNVWLGVSVEDQAAADLRIPALLDTPAAIRFLSCEPLLGPIDLSGTRNLDWVIVGGESGHGARSAEMSWVRSIAEQSQFHGVATFVKQLGSVLGGRDHKNIDTFPADLRVREFPRA